ncbi:ATP-dependent DNA helicase [Butyriboletus roseoflavus]|nr:ATP-dependent DNA helicase [Butyriboletus roseoflavus]
MSAASHNDLVLPTPEQFSAFPYDPPYSIQTDLMKHVYSSIERRHVTVVESPTGTGKTLSLLCSSLSWLTDERERARKGQISQQATQSAGPAWVSAQAAQIRQKELEAQDRDYEERLAKARKAEARLRALTNARVTKRQRVPAGTIQAPNGQNEELYLPDREMDETEDNISPAVRELMAKLNNNAVPNHERVDAQEPTCTKVYYASRTHSQLTQVIPELQKLKFDRVSCTQYSSHNRSDKICSIPPSSDQRKKRSVEVDEDEFTGTNRRQWRTVPLGSRKQLCINEDVKSRPGDLDEKCRELQDGHKERRCPHLPLPEDQARLLDLRDQILASPKDIEDLATSGRNAQTCPYYASRRAIPQAELVTLPYNLLLQKTAREALGIDLSNQIVIIDEAHNLIPSLLSLSSVRVTSYILSTSLNQVTAYYEKFRTRLSALHSLHLKRLINYMEAIQKVMEDWRTTRSKAGSITDARAEVFTISNFMEKLGRKAVGINLLEIEAYLRRSKIARKISGYAEAVSSQEGRNTVSKKQASRATPPLHAVEALMVGLVGAREDGRVILSLVGDNTKHPEELEIKYQLLNPSTSFREVVDSARSVILAGGTMSPISDVIAQLFSWLPPERLSTFSCGHIVPRSHVQTLCVTKGPVGSLLEFKYAQQTDRRLLGELGQLILNLCGVVPGGMVVFFPSYSSLNLAREAWNTTQHMNKFAAKKTVFLEPHSSSEVESTLREYADAVKSLVCKSAHPEQLFPHDTCQSADMSDRRTGAILFAVVGGKLSEGLNFSDELARAVVVIGLPFANKNSPELQERMRYANEVEKRLGNKRHPGAKDAAAELYENMCMSAVNQCIGRAIRHRLDWASLILVDRRYCSASIQNKLPAWIQEGIAVCDGFGQTMKHLSQFYQRKQSRSLQAATSLK